MVRFWSEREDPRPLAAVRIALGTVLVIEFAWMAVHGLVPLLFLDQRVGGLADLETTRAGLYAVLPVAPWVGWGTWVALLGAAITLTLGWWTRTSAAVLLLVWTAWRAAHPDVDRAVDLLVRNALFVLALSGAGAAWSVDARTSGPRIISSAARRLLVGQLVLMYTTAGLAKTSSLWWPTGGCLALSTILQDPAITRFDGSWFATGPGLWASQAGTLATVVHQLGYPLVLVVLWAKRHPELPLVGRLGRSGLDTGWIVVGIAFHVLLAVLLRLGMFPFAMLALYPAWIALPREAP